MKFKWFKLVFVFEDGPTTIPHPSPFVTFHPACDVLSFRRNKNGFRSLSILCVNKFWHVILYRNPFEWYPFSCDSSKFCHYLLCVCYVCKCVVNIVCNSNSSNSSTNNNGKIEYCFYFNGIICFNKYKLLLFTCWWIIKADTRTYIRVSWK